MKIRFGTVWISEGGRESPAGFRVVPARAIQQIDYVRAQFGTQFARGNLRHEISFTITRLHADLRAAALYAMDHGQSLPTTETLEIYSDGSGGVSGRRWYRDAVLARAELVQLVGITTIWAYAFLAGEALTRDPRMHATAGTI